jgi:hypothetical protein
MISARGFLYGGDAPHFTLLGFAGTVVAGARTSFCYNEPMPSASVPAMGVRFSSLLITDTANSQVLHLLIHKANSVPQVKIKIVS